MERMEEFIETLRLEDGKVQLQPLHRARMERTARDSGFVCPPMPPLEQLCPEPLRKGRVKCRFVYRESIRELSFTSYTPRIIHSFAPMALPVGYTYSYKSTDREVLNRLKEGCAADEVLLVDSEGRITDCSFANLAFHREGRWYTPDTPLLEGVQRQFLIQEGLLTPCTIRVADLEGYDQIQPINAMLPLPLKDSCL